MKFPEEYRDNTKPPYLSKPGDPYGRFVIPVKSFTLTVIACDGAQTGWDHVSVSLPSRCPNWNEMCVVKDLFWEKDEAVVQFHPPESDYVNMHPYCLHLWRPTTFNLTLPPSILVGFKNPS